MLPQTQLKMKATVKAVNTGKNKVFIADLVTPKGSYMAFSTDRATLGKKKLLQVALSAGCSCYL